MAGRSLEPELDTDGDAAPERDARDAAGDEQAPSSSAWSAATQGFRSTFSPWASRVRRRLALRFVVAGLVAGLVLAVGAAATAWQLRYGAYRPWMAGLGAMGALAGAMVARARRWSDGHVALYLDHKLGAQEAIATAVELESARPASEAPARAAVLEHAEHALGGKAPKAMGPKLWRLWHLAGPAAAGALVWLSLQALPPLPPPPPAAPGSEVVKLGELESLDAVIRLSDLDARDEAQKERLRQLSDRAKELRRKLAEGMPRREAQDEIAKLRDAVAAERAQLGAGEQRQGLESALGKLAQNSKLERAQKALGDRDLTRFDQEMERLANKLESKDRDDAKKALEEAARAAREKGAPDVAKALEEQSKLLDERGKKADKLRDLAKAFDKGLSDDAKKALKSFEQSGSSADQHKLADALGKALDGLSDQERQRLADKLKEQASKVDPETSPMTPMGKDELKEMSKELSTPEGQKKLADSLKEMAKEPPSSSEESKRQQGLGEAEKGLGDAQQKLGAVPVPGGPPAPGKQPGQQGKQPGQGNQPGPGGNQPGQQGGQPGQNGGAQGSGTASPTAEPFDGPYSPDSGGGPGQHNGKSKVVEGDSFRSKANAPINAGRPNPGTVMGRTTGREGDTANKVGTGALGTAGPGEVGAAERSEIPEEYREQVGRYFEPE